MVEEKEKEIIGYFTDDRSIYCVDCILKNQEMIKKKIEKAITADDIEEGNLFCDECNKEIKQIGLEVSSGKDGKGGGS